MTALPEPLRKTVLLPCAPPRAFALFTERIGEWWPPERRHITDAPSVVVLTPALFCERTADGARQVPLGRVTAWEPPRRVALDWYPGTDADHPTAVEITFVAEGDGTRVTVDHTATPTSAPLWSQRVERYDRSWELVLAAYARAAAPVR